MRREETFDGTPERERRDAKADVVFVFITTTQSTNQTEAQ